MKFHFRNKSHEEKITLFVRKVINNFCDFAAFGYNFYCIDLEALVVQTLDSATNKCAIHWTEISPVDSHLLNNWGLLHYQILQTNPCECV